MSKHDIIDDDGNIITPPEAGSTVHQLVWLLEYGRSRGFQIGPTVQIGDVIVQVKDLRQARKYAEEQKLTSGLEDDPDMAVVLGAKE